MEANCAANWQTPANHRGPTAPAEGDPASEAHLCLPVPLATLTPRCADRCVQSPPRDWEPCR